MGPVMPEVFSLRRRLVLAMALIGAVLLHGLALGGLIWFSSKPDGSNPIAVPDLHWVSIVARADPPESTTGEVPRVNPAPMPQPINPESAAFTQADSGSLAEPVVGPAIEAAARSASNPRMGPRMSRLRNRLKSRLKSRLFRRSSRQPLSQPPWRLRSRFPLWPPQRPL